MKTKTTKSSAARIEAFLEECRESRRQELKALREHRKKWKSKAVQDRFRVTCEAMSDFLAAMGWEWEYDFSGVKDPLTGRLHPTADSAFTHETERMIAMHMESTLKKHLK